MAVPKKRSSKSKSRNRKTLWKKKTFTKNYNKIFNLKLNSIIFKIKNL
uniref:Ribosomal protein L32 n=1 Tax=Boodleopsis sp. H.0758 TaxID=2320802 RepID=A0A386AZU8_9CHLO|nr:ribosomal protein L32 [Boodleopsis sp. H.0758]AYC64959.1 ribosomal protein L32 [Boodleopsis sp. H.0758]